jgi:hypothetical protein
MGSAGLATGTEADGRSRTSVGCAASLALIVLDLLLLARPSTAERPNVGVGRIVLSPPTQPIMGAIQDILGGELCEDRHTGEMMAEDANDKGVIAESVPKRTLSSFQER